MFMIFKEKIIKLYWNMLEMIYIKKKYHVH